MDCPTTGEVCFYRTQFSKIQGLAMDSVAGFADTVEPELAAKIAEIFSEAVERPETARCDENYCSALGNAVVSTLLQRALVAHRAESVQNNS